MVCATPLKFPDDRHCRSLDVHTPDAHFAEAPAGVVQDVPSAILAVPGQFPETPLHVSVLSQVDTDWWHTVPEAYVK